MTRVTWLLGLLLTLAGPVLAQTTPDATPATPSATPPATTEPSATPPAPPATQEIIYQGEATSILGRSVRDPGGNAVGRIVDVLVDDVGQPRAAVIDVGGFMGIGNRRIAVAWRILRFVPAASGGRGTISLDLTADQISAVPDFVRSATPQAPPVVVAAPPKP